MSVGTRWFSYLDSKVVGGGIFDLRSCWVERVGGTAEVPFALSYMFISFSFFGLAAWAHQPSNRTFVPKWGSALLCKRLVER